MFGEQVAAAIGGGWLDAVFADMESEGYACAAAVLPACSVGAPHIRQRLWFMADSISPGLEGRAQQPAREEREAVERGSDAGVADSESGRRRVGGRSSRSAGHTDERGANVTSRLDDAKSGSRRMAGQMGGSQLDARGPGARGGGAKSFWSGVEWLDCIDRKTRPIEPGTFPLANGVPARVGRLRGYGNAIVPQVAAEVVGAFMDIARNARPLT